jgi:hypothetical protein
MEKNDLASHTSLSQATMFEGVLASPPEGLKKVRANILLRGENYKEYLRQWTTNETPLKHLSDSINRLGLGTEVYTLLSPPIAEEIDRWLARKGISTSVYSYPNIEELADDFRLNRGISKIYVADQEHYKILGFRSTVVGTKTAWSY